MSARPSTWIDFHGIPLELAYAPFDGDAFRSLFARFPRSEPRSGGISITLDASTEPSHGPESSWEPSFFYGVAQGFTHGSQHLLYDGRSTLLIDVPGRAISGTLCLPDPHLTASGMQHAALSLVLRSLGVFDLHAAGACDGERALLIVGDSGAGKTTVVLSLLGAGCSFFGDDRVLIRERDHQLELLGYPREFHVSPRTLAVLTPAFVAEPAARDGKHRVNPFGLWAHAFCASFQGPLVVLVPRIGEQASSSLLRVPPAETFGRLLGSSASVALTRLGYNQDQLRLLKAVADSASAWQLSLGADALEDPAALARLIASETR